MIKFLLILIIIPSVSIGADLNVSNQMRAQKLYDQVRCPTCVAQSVKESDTRISKEIRKFIDEKIQAGNSDDEIIAELERYYGAEITFKPRVNIYTFMLWGIPILFLVFAVKRVLICFKQKTHPRR